MEERHGYEQQRGSTCACWDKRSLSQPRHLYPIFESGLLLRLLRLQAIATVCFLNSQPVLASELASVVALSHSAFVSENFVRETQPRREGSSATPTHL